MGMKRNYNLGLKKTNWGAIGLMNIHFNSAKEDDGKQYERRAARAYGFKSKKMGDDAYNSFVLSAKKYKEAKG